MTGKRKKDPPADANPFADDPTVQGPTPANKIDYKRFTWQEGDIVIDRGQDAGRTQTDEMRDFLKKSARGDASKAPKQRTQGS